MWEVAGETTQLCPHLCIGCVLGNFSSLSFLKPHLVFIYEFFIKKCLVNFLERENHQFVVPPIYAFIG